MNVKVLLFAHIKEIVGAESLELELKENPTGHDLLDALVAAYPAIDRHRRYLKLSMNGKYIDGSETIVELAEIAIFPPVSGG
jgi:molybdopterin converting factor subunit 1